MSAGVFISSAAGATVVLGPLALAIIGWVRSRRGPRLPATAGWSGRLVWVSALACTLAFNLTFFIQELFLVLPKALTPGLSPTLFHNNHTWTGSNPLADLFQGTGAMATLLSAAVCAGLLAHGRGRSQAARLFLFWMTYCGFLMALPQVVVGALSDASDLGHAMGYLGLAGGTRILLAMLALLAIPGIALWLNRFLIELAPQPLVAARARCGWVFMLATLPALLAILLIVPYRVPRELIEVLIVPVAVMLAGVPWLQAGAWRSIEAPPRPARPSGLTSLILATLLLLAVFQLVLRHGIPFY